MNFKTQKHNSHPNLCLINFAKNIQYQFQVTALQLQNREGMITKICVLLQKAMNSLKLNNLEIDLIRCNKC